MPKPNPIPHRAAPRAATLLAVATIWSVQSATAQQPSRVALVTPEVVCHVAARDTGRPWVREGCWVPESMVVSTEGAGHLRELADRLLSADALPPFEHLLAVHSLFVHRAYRGRVDGSAVLRQQRAGLAAKAVEAAQRTGLTPLRLVDRDPRIIMWIESLGDRVRYSESPSGRGTWTVNVETPAVDARPAEPGQGERAPAPEGRELARISQPKKTAPASGGC